MSTLTLILCILGLAAAFPNEENSLDIPLDEALDTVVKEPLNTIKDHVEDQEDPVNSSGESSESLEDTTPPANNNNCKAFGASCIRGKECCSGSCYFFARRCINVNPRPFRGSYLL